MTHALSRRRTTPREMAVTEFRSRMMDAFEDAKAGHIIIIERNGRPTAALVPVEVAVAYEKQEDLPHHVRSEIAAAVDRAREEISAVLGRLEDTVQGVGPHGEDADDDTDGLPRSITEGYRDDADRLRQPAGGPEGSGGV